MKYNVVTQEGCVVGSGLTKEDAIDKAEDVDGVVIPIPEGKTSTELYAKIQNVIDELDSAFFSGKGKEKIPELVFAINNQCRACVMAFVSPEALYDKERDMKLQYLGINPKYLDRTVQDILATICHELCHVYENAYIHIPRGGYHDKQWESLMNDCGLTAVILSKSRTKVSTKVTEGGEFEKFVEEFKERYGEYYFNIVEYSTEVEHKTKVALGIEDDGEGEDDSPKPDNADKPIKKYNRNKIKYTCPNCKAKVWGKSGLNIYCNDCECSFEEEENDEEN